MICIKEPQLVLGMGIYFLDSFDKIFRDKPEETH